MERFSLIPLTACLCCWKQLSARPWALSYFTCVCQPLSQHHTLFLAVPYHVLKSSISVLLFQANFGYFSRLHFRIDFLMCFRSLPFLWKLFNLPRQGFLVSSAQSYCMYSRNVLSSVLCFGYDFKWNFKFFFLYSLAASLSDSQQPQSRFQALQRPASQVLKAVRRWRGLCP